MHNQGENVDKYMVNIPYREHLGTDCMHLSSMFHRGIGVKGTLLKLGLWWLLTTYKPILISTNSKRLILGMTQLTI